MLGNDSLSRQKKPRNRSNVKAVLGCYNIKDGDGYIWVQISISKTIEEGNTYPDSDDVKACAGEIGSVEWSD